MKNYYEQIDRAIECYEKHSSWTPYSIDWICNRISWCWKWKKITEEQKNELVDRICKVMEEDEYDEYGTF